MLLDRGMAKEALAAFEASIRANPRDPSGYVNAGLISLQSANPSAATGFFATVAAPARGLWEQSEADESDPRESEPTQRAEPQATEPFAVLQDDGEGESEGTQPGDSGSWLAGLEPPDVER